jgi:tetratricopeptide (TPR) repeat protein
MKSYLSVPRLLYARAEFPLDRKLELFGRLTSDHKFYGEHYFAIGALASTMAIHYPSDKRAIDTYGDHLIAGGDINAALTLFKMHLQDEPPQMDYYMAVIDMEEYLGHTDSVDYYVQRAVETFPDDHTLSIRKANRAYIRGDLHGAIAICEQALRMVDTDSLRGQIWGYIGDTYNAIKERVESDKPGTTGYRMRLSARKAQKKCFEAYERSLSLHNENAMVLNNYAYFLSLRGEQMERASSMSEQAIRMESNNATYIDTYAWILYYMGEFEQARTYMRQALSLDRTGSAELPLHYGDILFALGERFMAETYWRKALEQGANAERIEKRITAPKDTPKGTRIEDIIKE